ncbi:MAG: hypothetical protein ABI550_08930 [Ignavibacteriaceae bacterium]
MIESKTKTEGTKVIKAAGSTNGLEGRVNYYKDAALEKITFSIIFKPLIISFVALIISFFLDLSSVPILGNITVDIAKALFPTWEPVQETIAPYSFWWLPVLVYIFFIFTAYLAYKKLKIEISRTPASETIDRLITSYTSVIDGVATALPLIGAAILLISIKLGEDVFLGLSVPFEIKALIVLAIGKLFEPVLDQLGVEFQNVVTHVHDIREKYFSEIHYQGNDSINKLPEISIKDFEQYKEVLSQTSVLSEGILKNFNGINLILQKINENQNISSEKIEQLNKLAQSITTAANSLNDEKTITGLRHLESIVKK